MHTRERTHLALIRKIKDAVNGAPASLLVSCLACARDSQGDPAWSSYLVKKWQQIVLEGGRLDDGRKLKGIRKQSTLLYLKSGGVRLHCKNLVERLLFESRLARGLFRLMNQLAIFALLLQAIQYTGDPSVQRGIFNNISKIVGHKDEMLSRLPSCVLSH